MVLTAVLIVLIGTFSVAAGVMMKHPRRTKFLFIGALAVGLGFWLLNTT